MASLEFTKLPLVEVTVRLTIARPLPFNVSFAVQLHSALKERLPVIDDLVEFEPSPGRATSVIEFASGRLLGARYSSPDLPLQVGVQPSLVTARWVQSSERPYPRFSKLGDTLWFSVQHLQRVFGEVRFDVANMSYTNFVQTEAATVSEFLDRYFVSKVRPTIVEDSAQFHGLNLSWRSADNVDLRLAIERGEAQLANPIDRAKGYKIVTVAGIAFPETPKPERHVAGLHDHLQQLFASILSTDAKEEWGYVQS